jgi:hypothetical protein
MMARQKRQNVQNVVNPQAVKFEIVAGQDELRRFGLLTAVMEHVPKMLAAGQNRYTVRTKAGKRFLTEAKVPFRIRFSGNEMDLLFDVRVGAYAYIKPPGTERRREEPEWLKEMEQAGLIGSWDDDPRLRRQSRRKK